MTEKGRLGYGRRVLADKWWFWVLACVAVGRRGARELALPGTRGTGPRPGARAAAGRAGRRPADRHARRAASGPICPGCRSCSAPGSRHRRGSGDTTASTERWPTDLVTGAAVVVLTLAGIVFPSLNALTVVAGLWLVLAPWLVGYGDEGGPVGLSDAVAGVVIAALGLAALARPRSGSCPALRCRSAGSTGRARTDGAGATGF